MESGGVVENMEVHPPHIELLLDPYTHSINEYVPTKVVLKKREYLLVT